MPCSLTHSHLASHAPPLWSLSLQCNHLDRCCKDMCRLLPLLGPGGFCKQLAYVTRR